MPSPERFYEILLEYKVDPKVITKIKKGFPDTTLKVKKKIKAEFFKQALSVMETELGVDKTREIFEANACCKTGTRLKASKEFARINEGLGMEEKLIKISKAPYMNMGAAVLDENGEIVVHAVNYIVDGVFCCACPSISRQPVYPESKNYCYCCAGHFKYHYEIMLGCKLSVAEIVSSPLDSKGQNSCVIKFSVLENL